MQLNRPIVDLISAVTRAAWLRNFVAQLVFRDKFAHVTGRVLLTVDGIWFVGHPLTSTKHFTEIVPGNPSVGGVEHNIRVAKYSDFGPIERYISETVQDKR